MRVCAEISFRAPYGITLFKLRVRGGIGTDAERFMPAEIAFIASTTQNPFFPFPFPFNFLAPPIYAFFRVRYCTRVCGVQLIKFIKPCNKQKQQKIQRRENNN